MNENIHYTLILGAEGELGKALAREIARKKCNLLLVSTTPVDLLRFSIGLQLKEDIQVEALKLDLGDQEAVNQMSEWVRSRYEVRAMINNVTCDWSQPHEKCVSELAGQDFSTRFRGAAALTMGLLPHLKSHPAAYIQHIVPFPFGKADRTKEDHYAVAKMHAYVKDLEEELKDTGVAVSMVHPSPIRNLLPDLEVFDGLSDEINTLQPRIIALKAINGMLRGDRLIIPGFWNKVQYYLNRQATNLEKYAGDGLEGSLQTV